MPLDTYGNMKDAIANTLDRDDLEDQIDDFIDLAEARHADEVRIREMQARAQASLDSTTPRRFLAAPSSYVKMCTLRLLTTPRISIVKPATLDIFNEKRRETTGRPAWFTVHEEIEFDVEPDQAYTAEMIYFAAPLPLSDVNPTNAILMRSPGLYLYGALVASAPFLEHDERVPMWEGQYANIRDRLNKADREARHPGPLVSRVAGIMP